MDKIIIGAGIYGMYSALVCGRKGESVLVLECDSAPFKRATYINQARVHQGYHYPRSLSTALKSAHYFERFQKDYNFCINGQFQKVYAISKNYTWSDSSQFYKFCKVAGIPCEELHPDRYFKKGMCDGAFLTCEYTYDAMILKQYFLAELEKLKNVQIKCNVKIERIYKTQDSYVIIDKDGQEYSTGFLLNASYASVNQILERARFEKYKIKYELCEIILCEVNEMLQEYGFTIMDGPFFSIMPFGKTGYHSLTSVTFTPHDTCYQDTPVFECQKKSEGYCDSMHLGNCNECMAKPETAFPYMNSLAKKYLKEQYQFWPVKSLFSMKPILVSSEIDDSRPTMIQKFSTKPTFISVLSGKVNTIYDLDEVLNSET